MDKDISLSKPQKKVASKVMVRAGYSTREIEKWLGVDNVTANRYSKQETPEELTQFETEFKAAIEGKKKESLGMVLQRIQQLIPKYKRLDHLVKAGEWFEGKSYGDVNVQVVVPILGKDTETE